MQKLLVLVKRVPLRWAALALALVLLAYGGWKAFYVPQTAMLNVKGQHSFRTAELSIWVDGGLVHKSQLVGSAKKRFGLLQQPVQGSFTRSIRVPAGEHSIRISIEALGEGYTGSGEVQAAFEPNTQHTVVVAPERRSGTLALSWRDAQSFTAGTTASSGTGGVITSLLLTVAGSILSAVVGFFVRERLATMRSKKAE